MTAEHEAQEAGNQNERHCALPTVIAAATGASLIAIWFESVSREPLLLKGGIGAVAAAVCLEVIDRVMHPSPSSE